MTKQAAMTKLRSISKPRRTAFALEPRMLFDGAAAVVAADQFAPAPEYHDATPAEAKSPSPDIVPAAVATPSDANDTSAPHTLVVIDKAVANWQQLAEARPAGSELLLLDTSRDGTRQIAEYLEGRGSYDSVHLISHGSSGQISLGNETLNVSNLSDNAAQLQALAEHLTRDADILIYGCDVAGGANGSNLLTQLAILTGADLAASTDATGSAGKGGNWALEQQTGLIETKVISVAAYDGLLAAPAINGASANQAVNDNATISPFSGVTISDADGGTQTLTVTLDSAAKGALSNLSGGTYNAVTGIYTFSGTTDAADAAIKALVFTPTANRVVPGLTETTTFTISVNDGTTTVTNSTTTVIATSINDAPVISGAVAGQAVNDNASLSPFAALTISDADTNQSQIWTVSLDNAAKGALGNLGGGVYNAGTYTFTGTASAAQAAIRALTFTPTQNRVAAGATETTTFTIASDSGGTPNAVTTVVSTSINDAPSAVADINNIAEEITSVTGNVLTLDTDPDTGDSKTVTSVRLGGVAGSGVTGNLNSALAGTYGSLNLLADGTYTYTLDNGSVAVQSLAAGQIVTDSFNYTMQDAAGLTSSAVITITVTGTNDAPVATSAALTVVTPVPENATDAENPGTLVSSLLLSATGTSLVVDVDTNDITPGIAVYGSSTTNGMAGTWQYKLNGSSTWTDFTPAASAATLIPHNALVRFVAATNTDDAKEHGTATLQYYAWDGRLHAQSDTPDVSSGRGGNSAFSQNDLSATINVTARNDAPTLTQGTITLAERGPGNIVLTGNASPQTIGAEMIRLSDPDNTDEQILYRLEALPGKGTLTKNGIVLAVGSLFSQTDLASGLIRYTYTGSELSADTTDTFRLSVRDGAGGIIGADGASGTNPWATITLNITDVNAQIGVGASSFTTVENTAAASGILLLAGLSPSDADAAASPPGYPRMAVTSLPLQGTLNYWNSSTYVPLTAADLQGGASPKWLSSADLAAHPLQYVPSASEPVSYGSQVSFGVIVDDGGRTGQPELATTQSSTVTINVTPVNDPPVANNAPLSIAGGASSTIAGFAVNDVSSTGVNGSRLGVQDADSTQAASQVYTLTAIPAKGWLLLNGQRLGVGSTFTQADVIAGKLSYQNLTSASTTDTDSFSYKLNDGDGGISDGSFNINLTTPTTPGTGDGGTLDKLLPEGSTQILVPQELAGSTSYTLTSMTTHGVLQKFNTGNSTWEALNTTTNATFTQTDITNGHIRYVNDGAIEPLAYTPTSQTDSFTVTRTGGTVSGSSVFNFTVTPVNDAPSITQTVPSLTLSEATPAATLPTIFAPAQANFVKLSTAQLQWHDPESEQLLTGSSSPTEDPAKLRYVVDAAFSDGSMLVQWNGTSWTELVVGQRFSALDVENGKIAYWHNPGSETRSNTLTVRLVDGGTSAGAEAASAPASVTFNISNVNDAPVATNASIVVDEGTGETASTLPTNPASVKVLTTAILSVTDSDDTVSNFNNGSGEGYYEITDLPDHGYLYLNNVKITAVGARIAHADIVGNKLEYRHDGSEPSAYSFVDQFKYRAVDPASLTGNEATVTVDIRPVNDSPVVVNNEAITTVEGSSGNAISSAQLGSPASPDTDADNTATQTQFRITTGVKYGTLYLDKTSVGGGITTLGAGSAFSLKDIQDGFLKYTNNGSEPHLYSTPFKDGFGFTISDASGMTEPNGQFVINVTPVNDAPKLTPSFFGTTPYVEDGAPVAIGATVAFSDPDLSGPGATPSLNGGTLTVAITNNQPSDVLSVIHTGTGAGQIGVTGSDVTYGGTIIGTVSGGTAGAALVITFNINVTSDAAVQALIRAIGFSNSDTANPSTGDRNLTITYDADGTGTDATQVVSGTATVSVTRANDAPTLATATVNLGNVGYSLTENDASNAGILVSAFVNSGVATASTKTGIGDVDTDNMPAQSNKLGIAITAASTTNGTWEYSTNGGTSWASLTGVSDSAARLLRDTDKIRFVPDTLNGTTATITYRAWDQFTGIAGALANTSSNGGATAFSSATDTASITVSPVNDAPTGLGNTTIANIYEDNQSAAGVAINSLTGLNFQDVDSGATLYGIAVVGNTANATTQGRWEYSSNGTHWQAIGTVDDNTNALVLAATTKVRFVPVADYNGSPPALSVRALDNTYGVTGSTWDGTTETRITLTTSVGNRGAATAISDTANTISTTVLATNDAPTIAGTVSSVAGVVENTPATIGSVFTLTDPDLLRGEGTGIGQVTLTAVSGGFVLGSGSGVTITSGNQATDRGAGGWGGGSTTLVFTGNLTQLKAALDGLRYVTGDNPATSDTITVTFNDRNNAGVETNGGSSTHSASTTITISSITPTNDAPVITRPATVTTVEDTDYTFSAAAISLADVDAGNGLVELTLSIPSGSIKLATGSSIFTDATGSTPLGTPVFAGSLTVYGTLANLNAALNGLVYRPAANENAVTQNDASRTLTITVDDMGHGLAGVASGPRQTDTKTILIGITPVNDQPGIVGPSAASAYQEQAAAVTIGAGVSVSDLIDDTQMSGATVVISNNYVAGDVLAATVTGTNITASFNAGTRTLTLSGVDSIANYNTVLNSVTFASTSDAPTAGGATTRTITWQATDNNAHSAGNGKLATAAVTSTINITAVSDAPAGADKTVSAIEDQSFTFAASDFGFSDPSDSPADTLSRVLITTVPVNGTLLLNGVTTVTAGSYITLADLGNLTYVPPGNANGTGYASFTFQVEDTGSTANGGVILDPTPNTITINISARNDAPTLSHTVSNPGVTENASTGGSVSVDPVALLNAGALNDLDLTTTPALNSAIFGAGTITVSITDGIAGDVLFVNGGTLAGINTAIGGTGSTALTITLANTATVAQVEAILAALRYQSTSDNPTVNNTDTTRSYTIVVNDGNNAQAGGNAGGPSALAATTISGTVTIAPTQDAPVVDLNGGVAGQNNAVTWTEGANVAHVAVNIGAIATLSDSDNTNLTQMQITVAGLSNGNNEVLKIGGVDFQLATDYTNVTAGSFKVSYVSSTGIFTITPSGATQTVANFQTLLRGITYTNTTDNPTSGPRSFTVQVTDAGLLNNGAGGTNLPSNNPFTTLTVTPANDQPRLSGLDAVSLKENVIQGTPAWLDQDITLTDSDSAIYNNGTITISGLLTADIVSLPASATASVGNVQLNGSNVEYHNGSNWVVVGTATGGSASNFVITLNASGTAAIAERIIENLTFRNTSDAPSVSRTLTYTVNDGGAGGTVEGATLGVTIIRDNDTPVMSATTLGGTYTERDATALQFVSGTIVVSDPDSPTSFNGGSLTVSLDTYVTGDTLSVLDEGSGAGQIGVSGSTLSYGGVSFASIAGGNGADLVIAFNSATATPAAVQALLARLRYGNTSNDNPTVNNTDPTRIFTVTLNDGANTFDTGADDSAAKTAQLTGTITITPTADAPLITAGNTTFTEGGTASTLSSGLTLTDPDDTQAVSATVQITANLQASFDTLAVSGTAIGGTIFGTNIVVTSYDSSTGTLTLTGTDTLANYQAALRSVTFNNTNEDPAGNNLTATRTITWSVRDANSNVIGASGALGTTTSSVTLNPVDDAPTIAGLDATSNNLHIQGGAAVVIDANASLDDFELAARNNWAGAQITLARVGGASTDDQFGASGNLAAMTGASGDVVLSGVTIGTFTQASGTLTISFNTSATTARVTETLQSLTYRNTVLTPGGLAYNSVSLRVTVNDQNTDTTGGGTAGVSAGAQRQGSGGQKSSFSDITVNINRLPIANADTAGVSEGIATTDSSSVAGDLTPASTSGGDVLDTDQDGDGISVQGVAAGNVGGVQTGNLASDVNGTYGKINVAADGSYTYTLDNTNSSVQSLALGETRNDVFTYTINDSRGGTSTSTVTVTVTGTNDAPITTAVDVIGAITEGSTLTDSGSITFTDVDTTDRPTASQSPVSISALKADGTTPLVLTAPQQAAINAAFSVAAAGGNTNNGAINWSYAISEGDLDFLAAGETVTAIFRITVSDSKGGSDSKDVTITLNGTNDAPVNTRPATATTTEDSSVAITGLSVADVDTTALTTTLSLPAGVGTLTVTSGSGASITGDGTGSVSIAGTAAQINAALASVSCAPTSDYNTGAGTINLTVSTTDGVVTDTDTVAITVSPVADIADDTQSVDEDGDVTTNLLSNDSFENSGRSITSVGSASNGTVTIVDASTGTVKYTPNANFHGTDSYTYTVTSPTGITETATVTVTVAKVDDPATIGGATSGSGNEDGGAITGTLSATDTADGLTDGAYFTVTAPAAHGTASIDPATGAWTYTPVADYNGADSFTVTVTDDDGHTATQVISLTVNAIVDIANDTQSVDEDGDVTTNLLSNDSFEGTPTITAVTQGSHGSVTIVDASTGTVKYTPNANFHGTDSYTYTVTSPTGITETATVTVTVNPVVDLIAADDSATTLEDTAVTASVATNDSTTSGGTLTYAKATDPLHGSVVVNADGSYTYTPTGNYSGADSFTYTVSDPASGESLTRTVNLTITPVSDTPTLSVSGSGNEDTAIPLNINPALTDTDGSETLALQISGLPAGSILTNTAGDTLTITAGSITLTPAQLAGLSLTPPANFNGNIALTITAIATDGSAAPASTVETLNVTVVAVNDPPVATDDSGRSPDGGAVTLRPLLNDSDPDGDPLTVSAIGGQAVTVGATVPVTGGVVRVNADGSLTFTPNPGVQGLVSFQYTISDGKGGTSTATIRVDVTPAGEVFVVDPPRPLPNLVSPLSIDQAREPSVFFDGDTFNGVRRLPIPFHPAVFVNGVVQAAQLERQQTDPLSFSDPEAVRLPEMRSTSIGAGLGFDPALFVQHAVRTAQRESAFLDDVVDGRLSRINLSSDWRIPTPDLAQPDQRMLAVVDNPAFDDKVVTVAGQPAMSFAELRTASTLAESSGPTPRAAPSFSEQLRQSSRPLVATDRGRVAQKTSV